MTPGEWRYFWGRFFLIGLAVFILCAIAVYMVPKRYTGTVLFEQTELYPGEDLALPPVPGGATVRVLEPSDLIELSYDDVDPQAAAKVPNGYVRDLFARRGRAADEWRLAAQKPLEPETPAWRELEIGRWTAPEPGHIHVAAEISGEPSKPDVNRLLGVALAVGAALGFLLAGTMTLHRRPREGDGELIEWPILRRLFGRIALLACAIFLGVSATLTWLQPSSYRSTASVELSPGFSRSIEDQIAILKSRAPVMEMVRHHDLVRRTSTVTERGCADFVMESLEIVPDPQSSTAVEIRFTGNDSELVSTVPEGIASAFNRQAEHRIRDLLRQHEAGLESALRMTDPNGELARELEAQLEMLESVDFARLEPLDLIASTPAEKLARDWLGWIVRESWVEVLRGCFWGLVFTTVLLPLFVGWPGQPRGRRGLRAHFTRPDPALSTDPY